MKVIWQFNLFRRYATNLVLLSDRQDPVSEGDLRKPNTNLQLTNGSVSLCSFMIHDVLYPHGLRVKSEIIACVYRIEEFLSSTPICFSAFRALVAICMNMTPTGSYWCVDIYPFSLGSLSFSQIK